MNQITECQLHPIGRPKWPGDSTIGSERYILETMRSTLLSSDLDDIRTYVQRVKTWIYKNEYNRPHGEASFSWNVPLYGERTYQNPRVELVWASVLLISRLYKEQNDFDCSRTYAYTVLKECAELYETGIFDQLRRWPRRGRDGFDGCWLNEQYINYFNVLRRTN